jgi:hypothetical protein
MTGVFIAIIGLLTLATGIQTLIFGAIGQKRYENSSGKLIRVFSETDQAYYRASQTCRKAGWIIIFAAALPLAAGIIFYCRPDLCLLFLRQTRLENRLTE